MKRTLERDIVRSIREGGLTTPGDRVGVAVSGGADSVALLRLFESARETLGITLAVVHFDHKLRKDSADDALFVKGLAAAARIAFIAGEADVATIAAQKKWNLEDAARRLRYEFFADVVLRGAATRIAVAHTMDDQAETVVARILRGAGPSGLAAIYMKAGIVVRPLLQVRRAALRDYLRDLGQPWREDPTNRDTKRQRAHIRENLLPALERDFSRHAVEHLANLARLSREEGLFWKVLVEDCFQKLVTRRRDAVSISIEKLLLPLELVSKSGAPDGLALRSLTERLIRRLYESVRGDVLQLTSLHVERVIYLATKASSGKRVQLPGGVVTTRNFAELVFSREEISKSSGSKETRKRAHAYQYPVRLKNRGATDISVPELDTCFRLKVIDCPCSERETTMWKSMLDLDRLGAPLVLRSWRPGDGFCPKGRRKTRKLKEMLLAARIPARERDGWPVLECNGRVAWSRGMEPAADFCIREGTRAGVLIEERKL
jgi:tRNA(Ile)-lysidine synthase